MKYSYCFIVKCNIIVVYNGTHQYFPKSAKSILNGDGEVLCNVQM